MTIASIRTGSPTRSDLGLAWSQGDGRRSIRVKEIQRIIRQVRRSVAHFKYHFDLVRGLDEFGKKEWRKHVEGVVDLLVAAFEPDDVVLGGGNAKMLKELPPLCRLGNNAKAFKGGFRMWEGPSAQKRSVDSRNQLV